MNGLYFHILIIYFQPSGETSSTAKKLKLAETWRGVSMIEIYQGPTPWSAPEFPAVSPAYNHTVLYHISRSNAPMDVKKPPVPQLGKDLWDREHVRMPCSPQSLYPVETVRLLHSYYVYNLLWDNCCLYSESGKSQDNRN